MFARHSSLAFVFGVASLAAQSIARLEAEPITSFEILGGRVLAFDLAQDGTRLATLSHDGTLVVRDLATERIVARRSERPARFVELAFLDAEDVLLLRGADGRVYRWQFPDAELIAVPGVLARAYGLATLGSGRRFATLHDSGPGRRVVVHALQGDGSAEQLVRHELDAPLTKLRCDVRTHTLVASGDQPREFVFDLEHMDRPPRARNREAPASTAYRFASDGTRATNPQRGGVTLERDGHRQSFADHRGTAHRIAFSPDGRYVAAASGGAVTIVDAQTGTTIDVVADAFDVAPASTGPELWLSYEDGAQRWHAAARRAVGRRVAWPSDMRASPPTEASTSIHTSLGIDDDGLLAVLTDEDRRPVLVHVDRDADVTILWREGGRLRRAEASVQIHDRAALELAYSPATRRVFVRHETSASDGTATGSSTADTWVIELSGEHAPASLADLGRPRAIWIEHSGASLLVADTKDRLRRIDARTLVEQQSWSCPPPNPRTLPVSLRLSIRALLASDRGLVLGLADSTQLVAYVDEVDTEFARCDLGPLQPGRSPAGIEVIAAAPDASHIAFASARGVEIVAVTCRR